MNIFFVNQQEFGCKCRHFWAKLYVLGKFLGFFWHNNFFLKKK